MNRASLQTTAVRTASAFAVAALLLTSAFPSLAQDAGRIIFIGESNTPDQRIEILKTFGASGPDHVAIISSADTADELGLRMDGAWTSAVLTCGGGYGIEIRANAGDSAQSALYTLPLLAAGVTDMTVDTAAPEGVADGGSAALAGMFKTWGVIPCSQPDPDGTRRAFAQDGVKLAIELGQSIDPEHPLQGASKLAGVIIGTQGAQIASGNADAAAIAEAVRAQASAAGFALDDT
ncbi:MAG: DUF1002 domain-containing protein, partial [Thermomicrobiales bacterium]